MGVCFLSKGSRLFPIVRPRQLLFGVHDIHSFCWHPVVSAPGVRLQLSIHTIWLKKKNIRAVLPLEIGCSKNRSNHPVSPEPHRLLSLYPISLDMQRQGRALGLWRNCKAKSRFNKNQLFSCTITVAHKIWMHKAFKVVTSSAKERRWDPYVSFHN